MIGLIPSSGKATHIDPRMDLQQRCARANKVFQIEHLLRTARRSRRHWAQEGWLVPVEFVEIGAGVRPKDFIKELQPHLAEKYAPLQANGNGNQVAYLVNVSNAFAEILLAKVGKSRCFFY